MKQNISPAAAAAVIVAIVIVLGFVGYRMLGTKQSSGKAPPEAQKWLSPATSGQAMGARGGSGAGNPSSAPGAPPGGMSAPPPGAYGGAPSTGSPYGSGGYR